MRQGEIYLRHDTSIVIHVVIASGQMFNDAGTGMVFACPVISGHPYVGDDHSATIPVEVSGAQKLIIPDRLHFLPVAALSERPVTVLEAAKLELLRQILTSIFD